MKNTGIIGGGKKLIIGAGNAAMNILPENVTGPVVASLNATPDTESLWVSLPLITSIGVVIVLFIIIMTYGDQISMWANIIYNYLYGFVTGSPPVEPEEAEPPAAPPSILPPTSQVFNVAKNVYSYDDAAPLCKAMGAELASYDNVVSAWKAGADWCNYGWIKGQAAVYPTQLTTFEKMQKMPTPEQRMACGKVGVNGGHFDNPSLRFGVNCYGVKPTETAKNIDSYIPSTPTTPEQNRFDKKVSQYKHDSDTIKLYPFRSGGAWSQ